MGLARRGWQGVCQAVGPKGLMVVLAAAVSILSY